MKIAPDVLDAVAALSSRDSVTVAELDAYIAALDPVLEHRRDLKRRIAATITPAAPKESRDAEYRRQAAHDNIALVERGVTRHDGTNNPEVAALQGQPGELLLEAWLAKLHRLRTEAAAREAADAAGAQPHRYIGPEGKHNMDERWLVPGEVVQLTARQAQAFRDRFAPVDEVAG